MLKNFKKQYYLLSLIFLLLPHFSHATISNPLVTINLEPLFSYNINFITDEKTNDPVKFPGVTMGMALEAKFLKMISLRAESAFEWQYLSNRPLDMGFSDNFNWNFNFGARYYLFWLFVGGGASLNAISTQVDDFYGRWFGEVGVDIPIRKNHYFVFNARCYFADFNDVRMMPLINGDKSHETSLNLFVGYGHNI